MISILIPVFNEEKTILKILTRVKKANTLGLKKEIIIINDGSTDQSQTKISQFKDQNPQLNLKSIKHQKNQGKGAALQSGFKSATGQILLIQDADLEYHPRYYPKLLKPILKNKTQVVYGSRLMKMNLVLFGKNRTPFPIHFIANKFLSFLTRLLFSFSITDMETGYKVISRQVYKKLHLTSKGFECEPEITAKILKLGFKIIEVPITTQPRGYQEGKKITFQDGIKALISLFKFRFQK